MQKQRASQLLILEREALPRYVVQRRHTEAGHHRSAPLLGQQLVPHHLLGFERMLRLFQTETQQRWAKGQVTRRYFTGSV